MAAAAAQCISVASFLALVFSGVLYRPPAETSPAVPDEVDFVIVGGGSGGAVLASRLSEVAKWQVLLLEAGPEEPVVQQVPAFSFQTYSSETYDWRLRVQPTVHDNTVTIPRGKMLGGCSAHNALVYTRTLEADHHCWAKAGARGWSFKEVLPYYLKSENALDADLAKDTRYHSTKGPMKVQRPVHMDQNAKLLRTALKAAGYPEVDLNGGHNEGFAWVQSTSHQGQRSSANTAFLSGPRASRNNLHVLTQALVRKVRINPRTKRAEAVEYTDSNGVTHVVKARLEVVLSAGTYLSPQLLMVSGVGPADQLKKANISVIADLPGVGKNLQNHAMPTSMTQLAFTRTAVVPTLSEMLKDAKDYALGKGPLTVRGLNQFVIRTRSPLQPKKDKRPYIESIPFVNWANGTRLPFCAQKTPSVNTTTCYYDMANLFVVLLHSTATGSVQLNTTDAFSTPHIYQTIFPNDEDVRILAAGMKKLNDLLAESKTLKDAGIEVTLPAKGAACGGSQVGSQAWFECTLRANGGTTFGHPVGTCSIGSVVDSKLRVLGGVKGLRVVDASVIPCSPSAHTNAAAIMIGERAADFIKRQYRAA